MKSTPILDRIDIAKVFWLLTNRSIIMQMLCRIANCLEKGGRRGSQELCKEDLCITRLIITDVDIIH